MIAVMLLCVIQSVMDMVTDTVFVAKTGASQDQVLARCVCHS